MVERSPFYVLFFNAGYVTPVIRSYAIPRVVVLDVALIMPLTNRQWLLTFPSRLNSALTEFLIAFEKQPRQV